MKKLGFIIEDLARKIGGLPPRKRTDVECADLIAPQKGNCWVCNGRGVLFVCGEDPPKPQFAFDWGQTGYLESCNECGGTGNISKERLREHNIALEKWKQEVGWYKWNKE